MNKIYVAMIASLLLLVGSLIWLAQPMGQVGVNFKLAKPIMLFCAASNRAVVEAIKADYEQECGGRIEIQYGASQSLLAQIEVSQSGDLFLPADESYLEMGRAKKIVEETIPLATMQAVVVVAKGNPKQIRSFEDLLRDDVRLVQASADAAAIGKLTRDQLQKSGLWERLDQATDAYRTTVTDVANDITIDAADAGIVFDAVLHTFPKTEAVELRELGGVTSQVSVGVIAASAQPAAALHFARFMAARDRGSKRYQEYGFGTEGGDRWSDMPTLKIYAGSMLRPVIDETITAFESREGVQISRVYNGCGILVGQMKGGAVPDAYFACDREFMSQVTDLFPHPVDVSENELVILVPKGNPRKIQSLKDLTQPNLRVGVGHEKQCAMGWLTQNTLREGKLQQEVMANVTVQTPTGDMLVNQLQTGSLDAAVAYLSNSAGAVEFLDVVPITGIQCAVATQPWAVAHNSEYPQLASRLFEKICSAESQQIFVDEGFRWQKK